MEEEIEKCCLFIDNSNLYIEGQKFSATNSKLRKEVQQDIRFRIDVEKLAQALVGRREKTFAKLYASEPTPNHPMWTAVRRLGFEVQVFPRNYKGREKRVDTTLTADVTEQACLLANADDRCPTTFIILSGDGDYIPAYDMVLKYGWDLEIVSWEKGDDVTKNCLSSEVRKYVRRNEKRGAKLVPLEEVVKQHPGVYYLQDRWKGNQRIPRSRTLVFQFRENQTVDTAKQLNTEITNVTQVPSWYHFNQKHPKLVLIIFVPKEGGGVYSTAELFPQVTEHFQTKCEKIVDYVAYIQGHRPAEEDSVETSNRFEILMENDDMDRMWEEENEEQEELEEEGQKWYAIFSTNNIQRYSGNYDDIDKAEEEVTENGVEVQSTTSSEDRNSIYEDALDIEDEIETDKVVQIKEVSATGNTNGCSAFTTVEPKSKKPTQKYSRPCSRKFSCSYGYRCVFYHTAEEKEHFRRHPELLGKPYKAMKCWNSPCTYEKNPKACPFAHSLSEARCYRCKEGGLVGEHFMDECPKNTSLQS